MTDLWSFLLQTLTASGVAVLLLVVKALLRDKLSPRWQFAVWGVLAVILLLPAGLGGRYALFNWPLFVETFKSALTGDFGTLTRVSAPVPLPSFAAPETLADWLFLIYALGVAVFFARYMVAYVRLRLALKRGIRIQKPQVLAVAEEYGLPLCPVVEVDGLPTAFICGVLKPVLALPAGVETDDKVILHELLHLKYKDVIWGWAIAIFRIVHWCNPLLWLCADWAGNDLESLCDQRVLERLEGEDRRDYGRILLSMADEKYARTPGTSSAANGGQNIRRRIEAIARFKRYPAGMALASVCVAVVLVVPMAVGIRADTVRDSTVGYFLFDAGTANLSSARTVWCTTPAGAFDAYAKAVLTWNAGYRAMCAPLSQQNELAASYDGRMHNGSTTWDPGLPADPIVSSGYRIYNPVMLSDGFCEGLLVVEVVKFGEEGNILMAVQSLRAQREGGRWVIMPQGDFQTIISDNDTLSTWPCEDLPGKVYEAQAGDFTIRAKWQTSATLNWQINNNQDLVPKPGGRFDYVYSGEVMEAVYTGAQEDKGKYSSIGVSTMPWPVGEERPELRSCAAGSEYSGSSSGGENWASKRLGAGWDDRIPLSGGGTSFDWERDGDQIPDRIAADLYLNGELTAELTLLPVRKWVDQ